MNLFIDRTVHCLPRLGAFALAMGMLLGGTTARAADTDEAPGQQAIGDYFEADKKRSPVANRFFVKERRLEISPMVGVVTNNPFAQRYLGSLQLGYHINDTVSLQFQGFFSPFYDSVDFKGDLKNLVVVLLNRASAQASNDGKGESSFEQPFDKIGVGAAAMVSWAPIYGKINLVGETVLNFDLYLQGGAGFVVKQDFRATLSDNLGAQTIDEAVDLQLDGGPATLPAVVIGIGQNYFVSQTLAVKIDARAYNWIDEEPRYAQPPEELRNRLYTNFMASAGISVFFPKMKPRLYDF